MALLLCVKFYSVTDFSLQPVIVGLLRQESSLVFEGFPTVSDGAKAMLGPAKRGWSAGISCSGIIQQMV